ncbi:hypothetical protein [Nocardioides sp. URHA0020]|uniref:hypothetical protein n=1 Tax=Nocardioides sp. URHA0020 TaxID=1380392 RepID=UPI0012DC5517|nr:hypothetical protein [Nocardioides sp. URHA0020]
MEAQHLGCEVTRCPACGRRSMVVTYEGLADPARPEKAAVWLPTHGTCEHGCDVRHHVLPGLAHDAA